ncbi:MAG TPA: DUF2169 domain-containing protein [Minicystis sp.]|nr:DUF2169 domain-containing protein [Minicystis sp.]
MRIKNLTPFPFGPKVTSRRPPQREMMLAVRGAFALRPGEPLVAFEDLLAQGPLSAETFAPGDDDRRGEALYPGDFADFKLRGEVLLRGTCHTPGGRPMKECPVRISVGGWSKILRVTGRRVWSDGLLQAATEPHPFTAMPITYANAFGGAGYAKNPVGKGFDGPELPNVELPGAPVRSQKERPEPAGFGPISSAWPQRAGKVGKEYGAAWRKTRAPFFAEDFDWSYFQAAPLDQQLDGYLRGDEDVTFQNLHPTSPSFSVALPALRVRAFLKDDRGGVRELAMVLDTLYADVDAGRLSLTWRGHADVREDDLSDVATLLVASEPLAEAARPEAHYRAILEAFEKDPLGIEERLGELPEHAREQARKAMRGEPIDVAAPPAGAPPEEAIAKTVQATSGIGDEHAQAIQAGLAKAIAKAAPHGDLGAVLTSALDATRPGAAPPPAPKADLGAAMRRLAAQIDAIKKTSAETGVPVPAIAQLESILSDPRLQKLDPGHAPPGGAARPPLPEPGPGVDCAGRDLSGLDLSGRDLEGANLEGADLSRTKLRGARLANAKLGAAKLDHADLEEAVLDGADLRRARLTNATLRGASLRGANLEQTIVRKSDLAGVVLDEARASMTFFSKVDLTGARARGVRFFKVVFQEAALEGADFDGAELAECYVVGCRARGLVAERAFLPRSSFAKSDLSGARFGGARGDRTIFQGATLDGADFTLAVLPWAFFLEAAGKAARFYGANLKGARFYRARLDEVDFGKANLMSADFTKAELSRARFDGANLYDAKLLGSAGAGADFSDANLKRALFEQP